jgi:hypothetical protein
MRADVAASWARSAAAGVVIDQQEAPIALGDADLDGLRQAHPLARVFPLLDDALGQAVVDCGALMAVADADGHLLWVNGHRETLREAERIGFVEGSNWDERLAGTNAPGLALATGRPATVTRQEHFRWSVRSWSCVATPIYDPGSTRLLGVLDITGGDEIVVPQTLALVRTAARLAEAELARGLRPSGPPQPAAGGVRLVVEALGRSEALLAIDDGRGGVHRVRLSPRHSEIVTLLALSPGGLSGDEVASMLWEDGAGTSTLRAEFNRLRGLLGESLLASRPYRLVGGVTGDWLAVEALLAAGDVRSASRAYAGPLLPRSTAPEVVRVREHLEAGLRRALLTSAEADLMSAWTRSSWGRDDYEMWEAQRRLVASGSPMRALIDGQLDRLDRELGGGPLL